MQFKFIRPLHTSEHVSECFGVRGSCLFTGYRPLFRTLQQTLERREDVREH